jgi:hypothetical protein
MAYDVSSLALYLQRTSFLITTSLTRNVGLDVFSATFVTSLLLLCIVTKTHAVRLTHVVDVSNNGRDFTSSHKNFELFGPCPAGLLS